MTSVKRPVTPPAPPASPKSPGPSVPSVSPQIQVNLDYYPHPVSPHCYPIDPAVNRSQCFICHGQGHWARDCTSLPAMYLQADAPCCFTCGGSGHYARFCPNTFRLVMERMARPRVQSLPPAWFYEEPPTGLEETPRYYYDVDSET